MILFINLKEKCYEKKIVLLLTFAFIGIGCTWAQNLPFSDAGSKVGKIVSVSMTGSNTTPIVFKKGTYEHMTVKFISNKKCTKCTLRMYGILKGVPVPYPVDQSLVTNGLILPLQEQQEHEFTFRLNVRNELPELQFIFKVELLEENGEAIFSFTIPAVIEG